MLVVATLALSACGAAPGPRGWAGARPVEVGSADKVLAAHKSKLYALTRGSTNIEWEFPPRSRDNYPISERGRTALLAAVEATGAGSDVQATLNDRVDDLTVSGPPVDSLKDAIDQAAIDDASRNTLKELVDDTTSFEKDALTHVRGLYGDIAVSDDGRTAYLPAFGGWLFALDVGTGQTRWIVDMGSQLVGGVTIDDGSPATLFLGTKGGNVEARNAATGVRLWAADVKGEVWATPTIDGDDVYVTSLGGRVYKFDTVGNEQWVFSDVGAGIAAQPLVRDGTVYVGSFDNTLYAIDAATGAQKWDAQAGNWFWGQAIEIDGTIIAGSLDGKVYGVDAVTGDEKWKFDAGSPVRSAPIEAGGGVVVAARDGRIYKIDPANGESMGEPVDIGSTTEADLKVDADDNVYVVPRSATLYIIDAGGDLTSSSFTLRN